jgi:hypothetical protein
MDTALEIRSCPNFNSLCALEPLLSDLESHIKAIRDRGDSPSFCANHRWYGCVGCNVCEGGLKQELVRLVGWRARHSDMRTEAAYDAAYEYLYQLLPPCRNCTCL